MREIISKLILDENNQMQPINQTENPNETNAEVLSQSGDDIDIFGPVPPPLVSTFRQSGKFS